MPTFTPPAAQIHLSATKPPRKRHYGYNLKQLLYIQHKTMKRDPTSILHHVLLFLVHTYCFIFTKHSNVSFTTKLCVLKTIVERIYT